MRRKLFLLLCAFVAVTSCGQADPAATSTRPPPGSTSTTPTPTSGTSAPTTTGTTDSPTTTSPANTTHSPTSQTPTVLVSNTDGVFTVGTDGEVRHIMSGPVAVAIDDTRGGLLFQTVSHVSAPSEGNDQSTAIWWLARDSATPRDVLVPSPGHRLVLEDATDRGGRLTVLYTRFEDSTPETARMSLRSYDVDSRSVSEIWTQGAWEEGFRSVSTGGNLIAFTGYGQVSSWFTFLDHDGNPAPSVVGPMIDPRCEADCPVEVQLSPTGDRFAYVASTPGFNGQPSQAVVVRATFEDREIARIGLGDATCCVAGLDLLEDAVLINRAIGGKPGPPLLVSLSSPGDPTPVELPLAGTGRFAKGEIHARDIATASDYYSLVGRNPLRFPETPFSIAFLEFGDPVDELLAEFGPPDEGHLEDGVWSLGGGAAISHNAIEGSALWARAPTESGVRLALYDGLVLGRSTVADLTEAWGSPLYTVDGECPPSFDHPGCVSVVYTSWSTEARFMWSGKAMPGPASALEAIRIVELDWPMVFLDGGAVALGIISEDCDDRGCTIRSDWLSSTGLAPLYSWGADCLDASCEFVAMFIGNAPPSDVPAARLWRVQTSKATGGLLLARSLGDGRFEVLDSSYATQSSERPLLGPSAMASPSLFRYIESPDGPRSTAWEIDVSALDIRRLICDGPAAGDCRPVFDG